MRQLMCIIKLHFIIARERNMKWKSINQSNNVIKKAQTYGMMWPTVQAHSSSIIWRQIHDNTASPNQGDEIMKALLQLVQHAPTSRALEWLEFRLMGPDARIWYNGVAVKMAKSEVAVDWGNQKGAIRPIIICTDLSLTRIVEHWCTAAAAAWSSMAWLNLRLQ
jgi:hypothetical protein